MLKLKLEKSCNLADFLREQNVPLQMSCGGHGSCATCRVRVDGESCLSCQTTLDKGTYRIEVPAARINGGSIQLDPEALARGLKVDQPRHREVILQMPESDTHEDRHLTDLVPDLVKGRIPNPLPPRLLARLSPTGSPACIRIQLQDDECVALDTQHSAEESSTSYVAAIDLGTTTVSCAIVRLPDGEVVGCRGRLNLQTNYASDVAARISFSHSPERRTEMQRLVVDQTLRPLILGSLKQLEIQPNQLLTTVIAGNTVMIHLLLGYDPTGLGGFPFQAIDLAPKPCAAKKLRLPGHQVEFLPAQSAYLGGDIISGLAALRFEEEPDLTLFVDIGTNAEMALKVGDRMLCTAVPAGPSFEGGGLSCGIPAVSGAIDRVQNVGDELEHSVIGNVSALGLCGSGIISFVAAASRAGALNKSGRFHRHHPAVSAANRFGNPAQIFALTDTVYVSEADIDAFLQAKAAIFSGIATLCEVAGIKPTDLKRVHIAGNFGRYIDLKDAIQIGLLPDLEHNIFSFVGNLSLIGSMEAALDKGVAKRAHRLRERLEFIELNAEEHFQDAFINALFIPNYDLSLFPSFPRDAQREARRRQRKLRRKARQPATR